jgi:cytochrome c-type biogenesis protein CcmH
MFVLGLLIGCVVSAAAAAPVDERTVHEIAADLRCVVCQSLSVADSPSETANQMRGIIRERLAAGDTPDQVRAYFVERYGQWILLAPPRRGFDLLVWIAPFAALGVGLVLVAAMVRRWTRRARPARAEVDAVDDATRARIAREMAEMDR